MEQLKIRNYEETDRKSVEQICLEDASGLLKMIPGMKKSLLTVFCYYYIEHEIENCFVIADQKDKVLGYILSAENFDKWKEKFENQYLSNSSRMTKMMGQGTIEGLSAIANEYPAHLHIDLSSRIQNQGYGSKLLDRLEVHLKEKGIKGICLNVATNNISAYKFYLKNGYVELMRNKNEIAMGKKLF